MLRVEVRPIDDGSDGRDPLTSLDVHLHYGGRLWTGGVLERALADGIERGRETLYELVSSPMP